MKRILVVYQAVPVITPGLVRGFESAGLEVSTFLANEHHHWVDKYVFHAINKWAHNLRILKKGKFLFQKHPLTHWNYLNTKLVDFYERVKPDYVFFIHGIHYSEFTISKIVCPKIAWLVDPVQDPQKLLLFINQLDWYFSYSKQAISLLNQQGRTNVSYLPHAVDHQEFCYLPSTKKVTDIAFVGKHSVHREKFILAALEVTKNISIYGSRWLAPAMSRFSLLRSIKGKSCYGTKLNMLYNSSKIVLSIIAKPEDSSKTQSGINMRPYEILASGSLLFSDNYEELHPELVNHQNLILFNNLDEFKSSLKKILSNNAEIEEISAKGREFIRNRFSYDEMARVILEKFQEVQGKS
jgi:hypothetical protein